jgi:hypothetical protein
MSLFNESPEVSRMLLLSDADLIAKSVALGVTLIHGEKYVEARLAAPSFVSFGESLMGKRGENRTAAARRALARACAVAL